MNRMDPRQTASVRSWYEHIIWFPSAVAKIDGLQTGFVDVEGIFRIESTTRARAHSDD
jgi:hypothetical protein